MRARLRLEDCEGRIVPSTFWWLGGYSGFPYDPTIPANWGTDKPAPPPYPPNFPFWTPGSQDDVFFDGSKSSNNCYALGYSQNTFNSLHMVNGYSGTVTNYPISVVTLEVTTGTIDPAVGTGNLNVSSSNSSYTPTFTWTGGTLNSVSPALPAAVIVYGGTATITPPSGGSLVTGDDLEFEDDSGTTGCTATFNTGVIDFTNVAAFFVSQNSIATLNTVTCDQSGDAVDKIIGQVRTLDGGASVLGGKLWNSGGQLILKNGSTLWIQGNQYSYDQTGATALTQIENGCSITVDNDMRIQDGKITTKAKAGKPEATIIGDLVWTGGTMILDDGAHPDYGRLHVEGKVNWTGGTFQVYVNGNAGGTRANPGTCDKLLADSTITVGPNVSIVPTTIGGAPPAGQYWLFLESGDVINPTGAIPDPTVPPPAVCPYTTSPWPLYWYLKS